MTIKFTKDLGPETGYDFKKGASVENAEDLFGTAQTRYFLEEGYAEAVGAKTETATAPKGETATAQKNDK